jgi:hypothetical protein
MDPSRYFLLGMMVAWTPSLAILAVMLSRAGDGDDNSQHGYARSIRSLVASTGIPRKARRLLPARTSAQSRNVSPASNSCDLGRTAPSARLVLDVKAPMAIAPLITGWEANTSSGSARRPQTARLASYRATQTSKITRPRPALSQSDLSAARRDQAYGTRHGRLESEFFPQPVAFVNVGRSGRPVKSS